MRQCKANHKPSRPTLNSLAISSAVACLATPNPPWQIWIVTMTKRALSPRHRLRNVPDGHLSSKQFSPSRIFSFASRLGKDNCGILREQRRQPVCCLWEYQRPHGFACPACSAAGLLARFSPKRAPRKIRRRFELRLGQWNSNRERRRSILEMAPLSGEPERLESASPSSRNAHKILSLLRESFPAQPAGRSNRLHHKERRLARPGSAG